MRSDDSLAMSRAAAAPGGWDGSLSAVERWANPLLLLARAMLAYIFIVEGFAKIGAFAGVAGYMEAHGVPSLLLPVVIATELGGGLLVLFGFLTRWAAIALAGFCLLTAILFHAGADQAIEMQKNIAMAGGFLALAAAGAGGWSLDALRARRALPLTPARS